MDSHEYGIRRMVSSTNEFVPFKLTGIEKKKSEVMIMRSFAHGDLLIRPIEQELLSGVGAEQCKSKIIQDYQWPTFYFLISFWEVLGPDRAVGFLSF